jgi:anti-sigma factor RsiW
MSEPAAAGHAPDEWTLIAYADGRLDADCARGREVAAWLLAHPCERQRVEDYARQDRQLRASFAAKLAEPVPVSLQLSAIRRRRRHLRLRWSGIAVAVATLAGLLLMLPRQHQSGDALEGFAQDVLQQVESGAAAPRVVAASADPVPMLMPAGFELTAERRLQAAGGLLTEQRYRDAAGRSLRLFMSEEPDDPAIRTQALQAGALHIVYWQADGRHYALSGEIGEIELQQIAAQVMPLPDDGLHLAAGDTAAPAAIDSVSASPFEPLSAPDGAQPASTAPALGIDPLGQIELQPALTEQPML